MTAAPTDRRRRPGAGSALAALLAASPLAGPSVAVAADAKPGPRTAEARTAAYLDRIAADGPQLRMFLQAMPKGADLHSHVGGSVYAEDFLRWAGNDGLCIATDTNRIAAPPCDAPGRVAARELMDREHSRYGRAVDALSTRGLESGVGDPETPGHDRFFSAFEGFSAAMRGNIGKEIAAVREAAAYNNVSYVEVMVMPPAVRDILDPFAATTEDSSDFLALSAALAPLLPRAVAEARRTLDGYEAEAAAIEKCDILPANPACAVTVRYQIPARRNPWPKTAFAELAFGFALAKADPRIAGVNLTGPEHDPVSIRDYGLHMRMVAFLKARNPDVRISLHAGELTLGLVAPRDLRFHIQDAVSVAGANRIGHGVSIAYEPEARDLMRRMARDGIAVEINLTSNAAILGVKGRDHPLALYRSEGVPVVLSTDDQGVSRSDMTNEYMRAVREQGLRYPALKEIIRNSLQYAFIPGPSLWRSRVGGAAVAACPAPAKSPDAACSRFLDTSPKARLQWRLEQDLAKFEREHD
ncbi:adenosine deaminase [Caulobacter sp. CCUG 60055]|uniref:adenosine deaminase family protein n=1 Tax=Caulobacter sp. CCUG 60055 TaxID=2100090 RepID=UPI001FA7EAD8|nr:adenosine deaminase [Caulobacter sp. CCUG 60055]MCI3179483.1 adenosine deaminase [Caulobacter sp. CCUG 60055]